MPEIIRYAGRCETCWGFWSILRSPSPSSSEASKRSHRVIFECPACEQYLELSPTEVTVQTIRFDDLDEDGRRALIDRHGREAERVLAASVAAMGGRPVGEPLARTLRSDVDGETTMAWEQRYELT